MARPASGTRESTTYSQQKDSTDSFSICFCLSLSILNQATTDQLTKILMSLKPFMRRKSMGWFLYDNGLRHERVNTFSLVVFLFELLSRSRHITFIEFQGSSRYPVSSLIPGERLCSSYMFQM